MNQLKVGLWSLLPPFGLEEVVGLAQVVFVESCLEGCVCGLRKHTLLLQDGEDTHRLGHMGERRREVFK